MVAFRSIQEPAIEMIVAVGEHVGGFVAGIVLLPLFKKSAREYGRRYRDDYWPW